MTQKGVSVALAYRTYFVSETCYRQAQTGSGERADCRSAGWPDAGAAELGLWPVLSVSAQCEGPWLEPQARVPDLL